MDISGQDKATFGGRGRSVPKTTEVGETEEEEGVRRAGGERDRREMGGGGGREGGRKGECRGGRDEDRFCMTAEILQAREFDFTRCRTGETRIIVTAQEIRPFLTLRVASKGAEVTYRSRTGHPVVQRSEKPRHLVS